ncbi:MAG: SIMPL domain-containing protein [Bacteroidia bacterium]|nr:SIMPL domain-containing protein [Bacteroidia bacterium]
MSKQESQSAVAAGTLALGLIIAALILGNSLIRFKKLDRSVVVKGLAEMEVDANLAVWPITFSEASNNLAELQASLDRKQEIILVFLGEAGFAQEEISIGMVNINDQKANIYGGNDKYVEFRYVGRAQMTVRTVQTERMTKAITRLTDLVGKGIVLNQDQYQSQVQYLFTELNRIKPAMIESATKNAREAAEKFASDSKSKVGKIKKATQGLFTIEDRDMNTQYKKIIRVVTTVEYYLVDK